MINEYFKSLVEINKYIGSKTKRHFHSVVSSTNVIHFTKAVSSDEVDVFKLPTSGISYVKKAEFDVVIEWLNK